MIAVITSVSAAVLSASILGGARILIASDKKRRDDQAAWQAEIKDSLAKLYSSQQAFGHDRIVAECNRHLHNGYITTVDLDNMMHLMRAYEGVGGNGTAHMLWEKVKQLPIDDTKEPDAIRGQYDEKVRQDIKKFMEAKTA